MKRFAKTMLTLAFASVFTVSAYAKDIPNGYGDLKLGMSLDSAKEALKKDRDFGYNGERDVSLLPGKNRVLIETDTSKTASPTFLKRCWFQFSEDQLYIIIMNVNKEKMDYYSMFTTLCEKYGEPDSLNPEKAVWKNDDYTMSLEKPLTLKYVDNKVFEKLQSEATVKPGPAEKTREEFLESL